MEYGVVDRLFEKVEGAGFERRTRGRHIAMRRQDDDGKRDSARSKLRLYCKTVDVGHPQIEQNAAARISARSQ